MIDPLLTLAGVCNARLGLQESPAQESADGLRVRRGRILGGSRGCWPAGSRLQGESGPRRLADRTGWVHSIHRTKGELTEPRCAGWDAGKQWRYRTKDIEATRPEAPALLPSSCLHVSLRISGSAEGPACVSVSGWKGQKGHHQRSVCMMSYLALSRRQHPVPRRASGVQALGITLHGETRLAWTTKRSLRF
jgi:hypothetical protein